VTCVHSRIHIKFHELIQVKANLLPSFFKVVQKVFFICLAISSHFYNSVFVIGVKNNKKVYINIKITCGATKEVARVQGTICNRIKYSYNFSAISRSLMVKVVYELLIPSKNTWLLLTTFSV